MADDELTSFLASHTSGKSRSKHEERRLLEEANERIARSRELNLNIHSTESTRSQSSASRSKSFINESNRAWMRKSFLRCVEQAESNNKPLYDVLCIRYSDAEVESLMNEFGSKRMLDQYRRRMRSATNNSSPQQTSHHEERSSRHEIQPAVGEEKEVSDEDINKMASQLLKAEMSGDTVKAKKLTRNLEKLREAKRRGLKIRVTGGKAAKRPNGPEDAEKRLPNNHDGLPVPQLLTRCSEKGVEMPLHTSSDIRGRDYGKDSELSSSLNDMIREERMGSSSDANLEFARLSSKCRANADQEYEDVYSGTEKKSKKLEKQTQQMKQCAIAEYKRKNAAENKCLRCLEKLYPQTQTFLRLPEHASLTEGHALLLPFDHVAATTRLTEEAATELTHYKRSLERMFLKTAGKALVFMEFADGPNAFAHHAMLECIPVERDSLSELKMYFKKSLNELGSEWDQNRRTVKLPPGGCGARGYIPPNFAYFAVEFGTEEGGFARVLDDPRSFPSYFGREVIAGVIDAGPELWRKPREDNLAALCRKVSDFEKKWREFEISSSHIYEHEAEGPALPP